jgi:hypothetical protein
MISIVSMATVSATGGSTADSRSAVAFPLVPEFPHAAIAITMPSQPTSRIIFICCDLR